MALRYLGEQLDIHGGGQDLIFPHHENETAQSEAYTGRGPFARYWVHNGLLHLGQDKMSKSLGNLVSLEESLKRYSADTLRIFFLSSHYRSPLTYTDSGLPSTDRLRNALRDGPQQGEGSVDPEPFKARFFHAMDSDLNTPQALAALFDLARAINRGMESGCRVQESQDALRNLGAILGLTFQQPGEGLREDGGPFIDLLVEVRAQLRSTRQYALADRIRSRLTELGVALEDTPSGAVWSYR
jgi:cysteinyl-tRNA synthetase